DTVSKTKHHDGQHGLGYDFRDSTQVVQLEALPSAEVSSEQHGDEPKSDAGAQYDEETGEIVLSLPCESEKAGKDPSQGKHRDKNEDASGHRHRHSCHERLVQGVVVIEAAEARDIALHRGTQTEFEQAGVATNGGNQHPDSELDV